MKLPINEIICGAMPEATKGFPDGSFNCSISSPPYWALRDYGVDGQLGLEKTFEEYISKLCTIYDEVKRVLRDDGTCWVNLGDTYMNNSSLQGAGRAGFGNDKIGMIYKSSPTIQEKSLCLMPQRFAQAMTEPVLKCQYCSFSSRSGKWGKWLNGYYNLCPKCGVRQKKQPIKIADGWILRNVIIWHKPNPMPSSAKDRFTVDFEYVYFFVKSRKYWFEPQYEPHKYKDKDNLSLVGKECKMKDEYNCAINWIGRSRAERYGPLGRNKRTVWTIPTQPFPEAHFATFPEKLVEPMIKAGCPEFVCTKCGKAREKILKDVGEKTWTDERKGQSADSINVGTRGLSYGRTAQIEFKGYTDCGCNAEFRPGIMLEPFCGSGTALQVAARLRRDWVGVELKPEYIEMAKKRAKQGETGLSVKEQKQGQQPLFPVETKK